MFTVSTCDDLQSIVDVDENDEETVIRFENDDECELRCTACEEPLALEEDGYAAFAVSFGNQLVCPEYDPDDDPDQGSAGGVDVEHGSHRPQRKPLAWLNSAGIHTEQAADSVTVTISVGDPRGGLAFTVRRVPDDAPSNAGRLLLHMPFAGEPCPHVALTEVHPGTYGLG